MNQPPDKEKRPGMLALLKPYRGFTLLLLLLPLLSNGLNLFVPKLIAHGIDSFTGGTFDTNRMILQFAAVLLFIFILTWMQSYIQTYLAEKVGKDLRKQLSDKISGQSFAYIEETNPSKLLTNLTADVDSIKMFISQAIVSIISSVFIIIGASILLLSINWKLGLCVMIIIPVIGITFFLVLRKVKSLFTQSRAIIDRLNKVISESILGSSLIRVINAQQPEYEKFLETNTKARDFGLSILKLFAGLIPVITFTANMAGLTILVLGGHFVISGSMSLGDFAAFNSYLALLIFPILVIGFMSNVIAQASASYDRLKGIIDAPEPDEEGVLVKDLQGSISLEQVQLVYDQKLVLKDISFRIEAGSKIAIIGPTSAGKTQLLYLMTGLIKPAQGVVRYDGRDINEYNKQSFHNQVGFVFQDSILFNLSIRENIAFNDRVTDESLAKAIDTAELNAFISSLPDKLDTLVSERGTSLSGGQKQRIMLARALSLDPKVLLLDDFTARVDGNTERNILEKLQRNYPGITLVSVTQKVADVTHYDHIIVLMQGEIVAAGKHEELMKTSPEYVQIFNSQQSTGNYEL